MKRICVLAVFYWLCGMVSAQQPNTAPATAAPQGGNVGGHNAVYTDRTPPEQMISLEAGSDKFQARHIADLSGLPRGAVIILHDSGQHPSWPFTVAALIDDLPLHGWDTLNIELPAPAIDIKAQTNPAAPTAPASANAPTPAAPNKPTATPTTNVAVPALGIEPQAQARISAAIKYFADQSQRNIVLIGFGSGAIRAAETVHSIAAANPAAAGDTTPITALVMIAPQQQLNGIEMDLPKLLPTTGVSTLDITLDSAPQARADTEARRRAILHQRTRIYTQLELPPINNTSDAQHSTMVKRVRAWMQLHAKELSTEKKTPPNPASPATN
ncbi:MAG TPA: DUF3530 family protein [Spongiibacteraceae bacterium]